MSLEQEDDELPIINERAPWLSIILAGDIDAIREAGQIARKLQQKRQKTKVENDPTDPPPTK